MNLMSLKKDLADKKLSNLYIFTGEEIAVRNIYIDKISKLHGGNVVHADSVANITASLNSNSLFGNDKSIFIIYEDRDITSSKVRESVWDSLKNGTFQKKHTLVLIYNTLDKKEKFYKAFSDYIISFDLLSTEILLKYVNKEVTLPTNKATFLIDVCRNDYNRILLELDKLKSLADELHISEEAAFDYCYNSGMYHLPPDGSIFDLLSAILNRDIESTYEQFQMFIRRGESPIAVLTLLHNNIKALIQLQYADGYKDLGKVTGLTGFQIKNAQPYMYRYQNQELIRMMKIIRFCEKSIKQTGMLDMSMVMDFIFIKIF